MKKTYLLHSKRTLAIIFIMLTFISYSQSRRIAVSGMPSGVAINSGSTNPLLTDNSNFGNSYVNSITTGVYRITNPGDNTGTDVEKRLSITNITVTGTDAALFAITSTTSATVRPTNDGNPLFFDLAITFSPTTIGTKNATVTITSNGTNATTFSFAIRGVAIAATNSPGGISSSLNLWLRADLLNGTTTSADNSNVANWQTQALGSNATVAVTGQEPKFRNEASNNVNFNPVVVFANTAISLDVAGTATPQQYLRGDSGYFTQDMFVVTIPENNLSSVTPSMAVLTGDTTPNVDNDSDVSGIGFGTYTARYDNEVISYVIGSTPLDAATVVNSRGFGIAQTGTAVAYAARSIGIINARNTISTSPLSQELAYNGNLISNTIVGQPQFKNFTSRFWLGRNQDYKAGFNGRIAEVITYSSRKNDASERIRIESYLAIKYGITLGVNGTSQNYVNSDGTIIWNASNNSPFNYNIAGIGRDDISKLTQKQSRSSNTAADVAIGLGTVALTNTANANVFTTNKDYLVWGSNDLAFTSSGVTTNVNLAGTTTSFASGARKYKIVETGTDVGQTVVSLPKTSLDVFIKAADQEYVLIVSSTAAFGSNDIQDIIPLSLNGTNYETWYDFDGTKYFSFGVATIKEDKLRLNNQTTGFIIGEKNVDLNTSFTVSAWVRHTSGGGTIVSKNGAYQFYINASNQLVGNWNGADRITSTTVVNNSKWHYVSITFDSSNANLYIDGVLDKTVSSVTPISNTNNFSIGALWINKNSISSYFTGDIDEVRIWKSALTINQIRYIMNQEIQKNAANTLGKSLPSTVTKNEISTLLWNNLQVYYDMNTYYGTSIKDKSDNNFWGRIKYLKLPKDIVAAQTAPLPYISAANGAWASDAIWVNGSLQEIPSNISIVGTTTPVDWNIIETGHAITSTGNKTALGLTVNTNTLTANNNSKIEVTHYLKLNGKIDLNGRSQLVQTLNSDLDPSSSGTIERDQQGTGNKYDYNYWSSPVGISNSTTNNNSYKIATVLKDGTTSSPQNITWTTGYDGATTSPITLSSYWLFKFQNLSDQYANWQFVGQNGDLLAAQGFTMKGTGLPGSPTPKQNYTFVGKPNNGKIQYTVTSNLLYLMGNPYASAWNAEQFISDNLASTTGTLYLWEHFGGNTHNLRDYQGGYATKNLSGSTKAISDPMVSGIGTGSKFPTKYFPVGQAFFVVGSASGGNMIFDNNQRLFIKEDDPLSGSLFRNPNQNTSIPDVTHFDNNSNDVDLQVDNFTKIRLNYETYNNFKRDVLLAFMNENATSGIDSGYDAEHIDEQLDDMYFANSGMKLNIQGDGFFNVNNRYPIGVEASNQGIVKFSIEETRNLNADQEVYIYDSLTETYHSIKDQTFAVNIPAGINITRFSLRFKTDESLGTSNPELVNGLTIVFANNTNVLTIKNEKLDTEVISVSVFTILGQNIATYPVENQSQSNIQMPISISATGTYIVKVQTTNGTISKKIIIR